jgi:hypothetical protein
MAIKKAKFAIFFSTEFVADSIAEVFFEGRGRYSMNIVN